MVMHYGRITKEMMIHPSDDRKNGLSNSASPRVTDHFSAPL